MYIHNRCFVSPAPASKPNPAKPEFRTQRRVLLPIAALALAGLAGCGQAVQSTVSGTPESGCSSPVASVQGDSATQFSLPLSFAEQLLKSADGMQPAADWPTYPKHSDNTWGVAFDTQGVFKTRASDKAKGNGVLDFREAQLASEQLAWDAENKAQSSNNAKINPCPISPSAARQAAAFYNSIFWNSSTTSPPGQAGQLRSGMDADHDGSFTGKDLVILSKGQPVITAEDFLNATP